MLAGASSMVKSSTAKPSKLLQPVLLANKKRNITFGLPARLATLCFAVTQPALPPLTKHGGLEDCIFPDHASWLPRLKIEPSLYHFSVRQLFVSFLLPSN